MARLNDAMLGTSGTPSNTNRFVTNSDPRMGGSSGPVLSVGVTAPITNTGTTTAPVIAHVASGVSAGSFTNANITVDAKGHVTAATDGNGAAAVAETPTGTVNGVNTVFTLSSTPISGAGVIVTLDGVTQRNGTDFTVSGTTVTFVSAPASGSEIFAQYNVLATATGATGSAGGDLSGTYPNPTVAKVQGVAVSSSAPTSGQVLAYSGSQWAPTTFAQGQLWLPPAVAHAYDDEFNGAIASKWTQTLSATALDPYANFAAGNPRYSLTKRPGWLMLQGASGVAAFALTQSSLTLPTNIGFFSRMCFAMRGTGGLNNDGAIAIIISDAGVTNFVNLSLKRYSAGDNAIVRAYYQVTTAGVVTSEAGTGDTATQGQAIEYLGIQKRGTTYDFWAYTSGGSAIHLGQATLAATLTQIGILVRNNGITTPGCMVVGVDFFRAVESADGLP